MKKLLIIPLMLMTVALSACGSNDNEDFGLSEKPDSSSNSENNTKTSLIMKITIGKQAITATMENNVAAKDLLSRLPLEITLEDFHKTTEKIFYPKPALNTTGVKTGCAPIPGDITIYSPWNNVAIFCKNWSYSDDLIKIGHIDGNGIVALQQDGDIKVKLERK